MDRIEKIVSPPKHIVWKRDGKEMLYIPAGEFWMRVGEGQTHKIYLDAFYIDRFPVTNEEYKLFVEATGYPVPHYEVSWGDFAEYNWDEEKRAYPPNKARHPVVLVSWQDALVYAAWAGKRLPTEAEWERAARGLDERRWPWGDEFSPGRCNTKEAGLRGTSPVDFFSPAGDSPEGVADMVGNVWEWTSTLYRPLPYDPEDGRESLEAEGWRTLRGGSWLNDMTIAHCAARLDGDFLFYSNVGFRCAISASDLSEEDYTLVSGTRK